MRTHRELNEISRAVRELRTNLGLTQQDFAYRIPIAIRTVARWENDQPPRGQSLVRLAQLAEAQELPQLATVFVQALRLEMAGHTADDQPELKGWLDGLQVAFRYRTHFAQDWLTLSRQILESVDRAARSATIIRSPEAREFEWLARQLRANIDRFAP